jgi:hypothetical protein
MKTLCLMSLLVLLLLPLAPASQASSKPMTTGTTQPSSPPTTASGKHPPSDRLSFQTGPGWSARVNLNADVAMVYGIDPTLPQRMQSWREHGYHVWVMTGVAWGEYQDYLYGRWDGIDHEDEAQTEKSGEKHGHGGDVYYMSPGKDYGNYLASGVKHALDAGAEAVCLEEPEFWVSSGWSGGFKREWKDYYHQDWQPPDSSAEAQYRASKLKYYLYRRALKQVFDFVREYGQQHHRKIPCYVATHSLPNYAQWRIVSPESSLIDVGCDGYIAQVWTGTARTPNLYDGKLEERTFSTAFLEYGAMQNLVRASGRKVWYLNDPVEDNPNHTWTDYRANWESTLTASLLQPEVWRYEIMPWPQRVFDGKYPSGHGHHRIGIPDTYETELQAVISALADMKQPPEKVHWQTSGTQGIGVLISDTMMFQRAGPGQSDEHLSSFYGLALPLLEHGIPLEPVQIESATAPGFLDRYKLLVLTYEGQKPPTPAFHTALAKWVRDGGALLVVDDDADPFNKVREWWNSDGMSFKTPRQHLFKLLGIDPDHAGLSHIGKGTVLYEPLSPAGLAHASDGSSRLREMARKLADTVDLTWKETSALVLRRGPYVIASGLDESLPGKNPGELKGRFINLFDPSLATIEDFQIKPGTRALLVDLERAKQTGVIAAAARVRDEQITPDSIRFQADGIEESTALICIALPRAPRAVKINNAPAEPGSSTYAGGILRLRFANHAKPVPIEITR